MLAAVLLLAGVTAQTAFAAGDNCPTDKNAVTKNRVSQAQIDLIQKRLARRQQIEDMQAMRARTIAEEIEADKEAGITRPGE